MKIRFFDKSGADLHYWSGAEWNHVPRVDDILRHSDVIYEITEVRWESPILVYMWLDVVKLDV